MSNANRRDQGHFKCRQARLPPQNLFLLLYHHRPAASSGARREHNIVHHYQLHLLHYVLPRGQTVFEFTMGLTFSKVFERMVRDSNKEKRHRCWFSGWVSGQNPKSDRSIIGHVGSLLVLRGHSQKFPTFSFPAYITRTYHLHHTSFSSCLYPMSTVRKERNENFNGWSWCCGKDHNSLQAQIGRRCVRFLRV